MAGCSEGDTASEDEGDADEYMEDQDFIDNDELAPSEFSHAAMDFAKDQVDRNYCVYVLTNDNQQTNIGSTNDLKHRLRQHAGEIKGGAEVTLLAVKNGFPFRLAHHWIAQPGFTKKEAVNLELWCENQGRKVGDTTADIIKMVSARARVTFPQRHVKML